MLKYFLISALMYAYSAYISYHHTEKPWYLYAGLIIGSITQICWLLIAKTSTSKENILINGVVFDFMINMIYLLIPILFFGINLTFRQGLGIMIAVIGLIITKV